MTMTELEIPERALTVACNVYDAALCNEAQSDTEVVGECAEKRAVRAAAPVIVAGYLRQLADDPLADEPKIDNWTSGEVSRWLRRCAATLDPDGATR